MATLLLLVVGVTLLAGLAFGAWLVARWLFAMLKPSTGPETTMPTLAPPSRLFDSLTVRALLIGLLALLMLIPLLFVEDIVRERANRHGEVLGDIARTWGGQQTLTGPVLVVPFTEASTIEENVVDADGSTRAVRRTVRRQRTARFLPTTLDIDVALSDEIRERSLFRALVYDADITLEAGFDPVSAERLSDTLEAVHWEDAWLAVGLSDTRAIVDVSRFEWNGADASLSPGTRIDELVSGFHAPVPDVDAGRSFALGMEMSAKGSGAFRFAPLGETTVVDMRSGWPHPSFRGDALPSSRKISDSGFTAGWEVPHLARNYPQSWRDDVPQDLFEFTAGVSLYETVSLYSQVTRAVKYGLLFVGLTFLTLLIFEITLERPLHAVQYALVGIALTVFFLVLLSLSEHLGFTLAYASASLLIVSMISVYTAAVLKSAKRGIGILALLSALYAILYSLLRLEDYALLMGTALLVVVIGVLMVVTRNLHRRAPGAVVAG